MKVVCIDNTFGNARHLDLWGVYDALDPKDLGHPDNWRSDFYILNIDPYLIEATLHRRLGQTMEVWVNKKSFVSLEEFRQTKLAGLGI